MRKNIIIGTTAINRPILHSDIIPEWLQWICNLREEYTITWFINIDIIDRLEPTFENTMNNFLNILTSYPRIKPIFLQHEEGKGNFLYACKRISENINNYYESLSEDDKKFVRVIWLEDDWKLNTSNDYNINKIIDMYSTDMSYINLTFIRRNYVWALAPSIIGFNLWKKLHYSGWKEQTDIIDPEHCIGLYYLKYFGKEQDVNNLTVVAKTIGKNHFTCEYMCANNSKYTYYDNVFNIEENERYIKGEDVQNTYGDNIFFVRMMPNISPYGCNYGRDFMEKHGLYKARVQSNNNTDFYKDN